MYRFKYYVLFYDDDKISPKKSNKVYELCGPTINLSILLQTTQMSVLHILNSLMKFVNVYVQDRVHITQNTLSRIWRAILPFIHTFALIFFAYILRYSIPQVWIDNSYQANPSNSCNHASFFSARGTKITGFQVRGTLQCRDLTQHADQIVTTRLT